MLNVKIILLSTFIFIFINNCAYQRINLPDQKKFFIQEINVSGDSRSAFIIKKKINRFSNKESENRIILNIKLTKKKDVLEKNIQNKITKYKVGLSAEVEIRELGREKKLVRFYSNERSYDVDDQYTVTVNNAKNIDKELINLIVTKILDELRIYYN